MTVWRALSLWPGVNCCVSHLGASLQSLDITVFLPGTETERDSFRKLCGCSHRCQLGVEGFHGRFTQYSLQVQLRLKLLVFYPACTGIVMESGSYVTLASYASGQEVLTRL